MGCCGDVMKPIDASACCTPKDTVVHAARAMRDSGCGCAPVVENRQGMKLVGVVTERDVCCGVAADDRKACERRRRMLWYGQYARRGRRESRTVQARR